MPTDEGPKITRPFFPVASGIEDHFPALDTRHKLMLYLIIIKETRVTGEWKGWTLRDLVRRLGMAQGGSSSSRVRRMLDQLARKDSRTGRQYIKLTWNKRTPKGHYLQILNPIVRHPSAAECVQESRADTSEGAPEVRLPGAAEVRPQLSRSPSVHLQEYPGLAALLEKKKGGDAENQAALPALSATARATPDGESARVDGDSTRDQAPTDEDYPSQEEAAAFIAQLRGSRGQGGPREM